jgi:hypothetical protein
VTFRQLILDRSRDACVDGYLDTGMTPITWPRLESITDYGGPDAEAERYAHVGTTQ